jgi:uncharacterized membrane protein
MEKDPARTGRGSRTLVTSGVVLGFLVLISMVSGPSAAGTLPPTDEYGQLDDSGSTTPKMTSLYVDIYEDTIIVDPYSWDGVAKGRISLEGVPPNTLIVLDVEMDNDWEASIYPEVIRSVRPLVAASWEISVRVSVPPAEEAYQEGSLFVTATVSSPHGGTSKVGVSVGVLVGQSHDLDVKWDTERVRCCQDDTVMVRGTLTNNGNGEETVEFFIDKPFPGASSIAHFADVPMNGTKEFTVAIDVPSDATLEKHRLLVSCYIIDFFTEKLLKVSERTVEVDVYGYGSALAIELTDILPPTLPQLEDIETEAGGKVTFDGAEASDNVGVEEWTWTFEEGGETVVLEGMQTEHTFDEPGEYEVTLTVVDAHGNKATETFTVNVSGSDWFWVVIGVAAVVAAVLSVVLIRRSRYSSGADLQSPQVIPL